MNASIDMTVLITGAGGYIGSVTTSFFLSNGITVIAVDNFSTGYRSPLVFLSNHFPEQLVWYERDIRDGIDDVFQSHPEIDVVIHCAARCSVDESMKHPLLYFDTNVFGTLSMLKSMEKAGVYRIVFSSTCAVYHHSERVIDENHPCAPISPYGQSKRIAEETLEYLGTAGTIQSVILRYFNICGATDDGCIGDSKRPSGVLMQNAIRGALGIESFFLTCPYVNTPDGTPIRDYVNVVDLADVHLRAVEYCLRERTSAIMNIGTGIGYSVHEIIQTVERVTGVPLSRRMTTPRQGEMTRAVATNTRAHTLLGWTPKHTIEDSVRSLLTWYTNHPNGWEY